jgi:hypothetical protein
MRKTKLKLLNFSLLLLLIYSCSNQEDYISNHHHSEKIENEITFQQFLNETNVNDFSVKLKLNPANNALQRTASLNDFVIDTVAILKHISQDNKATYSFKVEPINTLEYSEAKSYNVIYHKIANSWEKTLISFDEIENPINNTKSFDNFDNLYSESPIMARVCMTIIALPNCNNQCVGTCDRCHACTLYVAVETGCGGGSDGGIDDVTPLDLGSSGSTGGSSAILEFEPNPKGGGGSLFDNPNPTPCEDLKKKSIQDLVFKNKIDSLKNLVSANNPNRDTHETSVVMKRLDDVYYYNVYNSNIENSQTVSVKYTASNYDVAVLHNHPINTLPIYSPRDIVDLFDNYNFVTQSRKEEYTSYLVNFNNTTYAIKMENIGVLNDLIGEFDYNTEDGFKKASDRIMTIYEKYGFKETQTYTQYMAEELFLNVMNDPKFGSGSSIGIYRQTNGTWGKLSKSGGSVISTPCPN